MVQRMSEEARKFLLRRYDRLQPKYGRCTLCEEMHVLLPCPICQVRHCRYCGIEVDYDRRICGPCYVEVFVNHKNNDLESVLKTIELICNGERTSYTDATFFPQPPAVRQARADSWVMSRYK